MIWTRRRLLGAALLVPLEGLAQTCGVITPRQTEGPFFTPNSPLRASLVEAGTKAPRMLVSGRVLSPQCQPVANALVDLWHADEEGAYDNRGYRYRGHQFTDREGRYRFETIVPALYPGRARHYHVKVQAKGGRVLTTQLYFPGDPGNRRDGLYRPELELKTSNKAEGAFDFVVDAWLRPDWHALFAPLPPEAAVQRARLLVPGWEQITVELSAGEAGLRHAMVVLDETGTPISAGDWVMYRTQGEGEVTYVHENVGGRLEADGSFLGTRWRSVAVEREGSEEALTQEMSSSKPSAEDVAGIKTLVLELLRRVDGDIS